MYKRKIDLGFVLWDNYFLPIAGRLWQLRPGPNTVRLSPLNLNKLKADETFANLAGS